ncbi:cysteine proteinase [Teratosphaeria destructans]|uniref:Cysteine proteinase n=1 Tax=Teratosphaeria destructans TaxID=418781 RepID=A0A9W7SZU3_9PEZI|nr:cysteine proteinase [Teratosphaeria destructans]
MRVPDGVLKGSIWRNWPQRRPLVKTRLKGMVNRGAECYKIALLHTLLHVPQMHQYLGNVHKRCDLQANQCGQCAAQPLWQIYWDDHRWAGDPNRLRDAEAKSIAALKVSAPAGVQAENRAGQRDSYSWTSKPSDMT